MWISTRSWWGMFGKVGEAISGGEGTTWNALRRYRITMCMCACQNVWTLSLSQVYQLAKLINVIFKRLKLHMKTDVCTNTCAHTHNLCHILNSIRVTDTLHQMRPGLFKIDLHNTCNRRNRCETEDVSVRAWHTKKKQTCLPLHMCARALKLIPEACSA